MLIIILGVGSPAPSSASSVIDDLAPFAALLTDEDRERKAEASIPGTFNVIVNPDSFQHLAEYAGDDSDSKRNEVTALRRGSIAASLASSIGRDSVLETISIPGDPNIIILPRFEDLSRKTTRELRSPISPNIPPRPVIKQEESESILPSHSPEITVLRHFRDVVWKRLVPLEHESDSSIILLDDAAITFAPVGLSDCSDYLVLIRCQVDTSHDGIRLFVDGSARRQRQARFVTILFSDFTRVTSVLAQ